MSESSSKLTNPLTSDLGNVTKDKPPVILVLGMAGSGKSSFVQVCCFCRVFYIILIIF